MSDLHILNTNQSKIKKVLREMIDMDLESIMIIGSNGKQITHNFMYAHGPGELTFMLNMMERKMNIYLESLERGEK